MAHFRNFHHDIFILFSFSFLKMNSTDLKSVSSYDLLSEKSITDFLFEIENSNSFKIKCLLTLLIF